MIAEIFLAGLACGALAAGVRRRLRERPHEPRLVKLLPAPDSPEKRGGQPLSPHPLGSFESCRACGASWGGCADRRRSPATRLACCERCDHGVWGPPPTPLGPTPKSSSHKPGIFDDPCTACGEKPYVCRGLYEQRPAMQCCACCRHRPAPAMPGAGTPRSG